MAVRIRKQGTVIASFATAQQVDISHANDSIRLGDGTNFLGSSLVGGSYALKVDVVQSVAGGTAPSHTDDAAFSVGSGSVSPIGAMLDDSATDSVNEGDVGVLRMSATRDLHVMMVDGVGDSAMDDANNALRVNVVAGSSGGVSATDDAAFSVGSGTLVPVGAMADESAPDSVDEGDVGVLRMTLDRLLKIQVAGVASGIAVPVTDNSSTLSVDDGAGSLTVDNGGTFAVQDSQVLADNAGFTDGTSKVFAAGYIYDEVAGTALTENDVAAARINVNRAQVATIEDGTTRGRYATVTASNALKVDASAVAVPVTDNSGSLTIDSAGIPTALGQSTMANSMRVVVASDQTDLPVAAQHGITQASSLSALNAAVTMTTEAVGVFGVQVTGTFSATLTFESTIDGTNWYAVKAMPVGGGTIVTTTTATGQWAIPCHGCHNYRVRVSAYTSGTAVVSVVAKPGVSTQFMAQQTMANSLPVVIASDQSNVPVSQATASNLNAQVVGSIAHDGADSGNPVKVGAYATSSNRTRVASADRADVISDLAGRLVVVPHQVRELITKQTTTISTTTETTILTAVSSTFLDLVMLVITNTSATATRVDIRDTTAGTVLWSVAVAANGGAVLNFPVAIPQTTVNTNWTAQLSGAVTDIRILAVAVKNI